MVKGNRVIEPSSKDAVQRFDKGFELLEPLPERALKILAVLGADGVASEAVRIAKCVKSNVSYWKDRFISRRFELFCRDFLVQYLKGQGESVIRVGRWGVKLKLIVKNLRIGQLMLWLKLKHAYISTSVNGLKKIGWSKLNRLDECSSAIKTKKL